MMKRKGTTRSALFTSIISLLLCVSMLVGTTFAWFTDSVASGNNLIAAGRLDVELEYAVLNQNGSVQEWKTVNGATNLFTGNLWEPGHTEVIYLRLSNQGSLALKYNLGINIVSETGGINVAGEPFMLSDYIYMGVVENAEPTFVSREKAIDEAQKGANGSIGMGYTKAGSMTTGQAAQYLAVVVYMPTFIGNEANAKTGTNAPEIHLGINLFATQLEAETDSFGPDYDKDAVWTGEVGNLPTPDENGVVTITTAGELAAFAADVNGGNSYEGKTVKLGADIDLNEVNWTPIGTSASPFKGTFLGTGYTIKNLKSVGSKHVGLFGATGVGAHIEGVTVVGAYVSGEDYVGVIVGGGYLARNCIKNCYVENATVIATPYFDTDKGVYDGGAKAGGIVGQAYNGNLIDNTVKNTTITAYRDLGSIAGMLDFDGTATVEASGNTAENVTLNYIGAAGKYDGDKANGNMAAIVGRVGVNAEAEATENTVTNVDMNKDNSGAIMISTLDELIAFAKDVNAGNTYKGKTVILGADIDLRNMEWTPIGNATNKFQGIFNGNGKTISNLKVTGYNSDVGLFGFTTDGEVKNLTVENASVAGRLNVGVVAGTPYTSKYTNITVKGHVEVNGMAYVGGVGGKNAYANWTDITVKADETSYVKAVSTENGKSYRTYVGGVVGFNGEGGHTFKNITTNIDVIGDVCDIGGAFGIAHYGNKFENITVTGNVTSTGEANEIGGIAGVWHNENGTSVSFTNCNFQGTVSAVNGAVADCEYVGGAYNEDTTGKLYIDGVCVWPKWDGKTTDTTWYNEEDTEFELSSGAQLAGLAELVDKGTSFAGKTITLSNDIDLYVEGEDGEPVSFEPIGSYRNNTPFKGTFDGNGYAIKNLSQNTWALDNGYEYGDLGMGLFGKVQDATIKNLTMDGAELSGESAICGIVAGTAYGDCVFENIKVTNSKGNDYQYYAGGVVGWASGNHTYKNIIIDESTIIGSQWGDFGNCNGGIIGGCGSSAQILLEDCTVACRIDATNDIVSAYQWECYRNSGMLIGNTGHTATEEAVTTAAAPNVTCKNVTVIYGDWANYTYCEFAGTGYPYVRVQAGVSVDAYSNVRYGHPTDANGNTVVDDNHVHNDGEKHQKLIAFDQLFGGKAEQRYCTYGVATHPGVTVIYNNK